MGGFRGGDGGVRDNGRIWVGYRGKGMTRVRG